MSASLEMSRRSPEEMLPAAVSTATDFGIEESPSVSLIEEEKEEGVAAEEEVGCWKLPTLSEECWTPNAEESKIAIRRSCPPAPKKRKAVLMRCRRRLFDVQLIRLDSRQIEGLFPKREIPPENSSSRQSSSQEKTPVTASDCRKRKRGSSDEAGGL